MLPHQLYPFESLLPEPILTPIRILESDHLKPSGEDRRRKVNRNRFKIKAKARKKRR